MNASRIALLAASLAGCATAEEVKELEARLAALEEKVQNAPAAGAAAPGAPTVEQEQQAQELYGQVMEAMQANKIDEAKAKVDELMQKYGATRTARRLESLQGELAVIGKDAPTLEVEKWYQGEGVSLTGSAPTLVVFWEVWCPHCKREVPKLQATYDKYSPKGLQMVGLTRITKSATEESVQEFMKEQNVKYPIAKETGTMADYFAVRGIPAAAVVKDGKVVWRGHPARITDEMIEGWL